MNIGDLRHRIEVWEQQLTDDGALGTKAVWSKSKELWAKVSAGESSAQLQNGQTVTTQPYTIYLRWNRDFKLDITQKYKFHGIDIIPESIVNVDFRHNICEIKGFATLEETAYQVAPQAFENKGLQYYEDSQQL